MYRRTVTGRHPPRLWETGGYLVDIGVDGRGKRRTPTLLWTNVGVSSPVFHASSTHTYLWSPGLTPIIPTIHSTEDDDGLSL
jgi:hypothetical protein